jgi:group I intron endonuclease
MHVYLLINVVNGKGYVGITSGEVSRRMDQHYDAAKYMKETLLARALRKYGADGFVLTILGHADSWEELCAMERAAIQTHNTFAFTKTGHGYNMTLGGEGAAGLRQSAEHRQRIGDAQRGEKNHRYGKGMDEAHKQKLIAIHTGRVFADATREKLRQANLGKTMSPEARQKMRDVALARVAAGTSPSRGKPKSPEHRAKLAAATKAYLATHGNPMQGRTQNAETRAKIAAKATGRVPSPATRAKIAESLTGQKVPSRGRPGRPSVMQGKRHTEAAKQKMAASRRGGKNPLARAIELDGVLYPSIMDAVRATSYSHWQITYRLKNGGARYVDNKGG